MSADDPSSPIDARRPCPAGFGWDDLPGDERARFCAFCQETAWNLSAMSRREAEAFLAARAGRRTCKAIERRPDGTVLHRPDPSPVVTRRTSGARWAWGLAPLLALLGLGTLLVARPIAVEPDPAPTRFDEGRTELPVAPAAPRSAPVRAFSVIGD